jgi:predicted Zn-dependent protease
VFSREFLTIGDGAGIAPMRGMASTLHRTTRHLVLALAASLTISASAQAQTRIERHSNRFSAAQDVELGRQAAAEIRRELPIVRDRRTQEYVERIGERLVGAIPGRLREPSFRYSFQVVDRRDINAFALPGGPIFVNRGMLDAASTEGEVAGVIAHELSHIVLRHGTAQATKGQTFQLGAIAGQLLGRWIGGRAGTVVAQGSQIGLGTYFLKYSREYEREADLLGAQIMARAGYDPRAMANMFRTIARRSGNGGPEWLSDHPSPANRYEAIHREAALLRVGRS